ncbi:MAG TPA: hypothetical protein VM580_06765 [Labilithrix sp.]|nr:hypothetical protein [Labilithrix sp.]
MSQTQAAVTTGSVLDGEDRYGDFLSGIQEHFDAMVRTAPRLFVTDAAGLWEAYLDNAFEGTRQSLTCGRCRKFIQRFGGLVTISEAGETASAIWPTDAPPHYADAVRAMTKLVHRANVTGVFRAKDKTWGTPKTGPWTHIALVAPQQLLSAGVLTTPVQEMAAKREEFEMLQRSLAEFPVEAVRKAHAFLSSEALYRSEKVEGVAKWLLTLHEALAAAGKNKRARDNLVWLAVAKAPPGFCHVRSGMIGTLLEDIVADLPFETVKRKFAKKMDPLQYMRPQAAPSAGNIAQAEKLVAALQSAGALERRFAKLSDVQALWLPKASQEEKPTQGGVFGHLAKKADLTLLTSDAPATVMTWAKFSANVLPTAEAIEFLVPHGREAYTAMVTAKNADAPTLLQWGNPVSHYVYHSGSEPSQWNLVGGSWHRVTAVVLRSWMWGAPEKFAHHGAGVVFVLDGCKDVTYQRSGGMFPEQMKSEYHPIRRTLEAYFQNATIEGKDEAEACGIALVKGATWNLTFRVTSRGVRTDYKLDRWD